MAKAALSIDGGVTGLAMPNVLKRLRSGSTSARGSNPLLYQERTSFPASGVR